jgi:hypothetical protein
MWGHRMSDELNHSHSNPETGFEREDLSTRGVFVFMIGLGIIGLVIYFIIRGMYGFLDNYEKSQQSTGSPLVTSTGPAARVVTKQYMEKFKENGVPMLESDERGQFKDFLLKQEDQLNSYGWIDQPAGVAHIPIERAMDLIVQRGLPVLPAGTGETNTSASAKAPVKNQAAEQGKPQ